mmetsp:Transcript_33180/g.76553  ORF Transcript_33180/g.76553 Transcript_33180/m.76553 type:complete len:83 (+) Transcript_33180:2492-2740(+)
MLYVTLRPHEVLIIHKGISTGHFFRLAKEHNSGICAKIHYMVTNPSNLYKLLFDIGSSCYILTEKERIYKEQIVLFNIYLDI